MHTGLQCLDIHTCVHAQTCVCTNIHIETHTCAMGIIVYICKQRNLQTYNTYTSSHTDTGGTHGNSH